MAHKEENRALPIGVSDFKEIREYNYCYVDKTKLISEFLKSGSKVSLFTRPRRFGKTLNMSMLKNFLDCNSPSSKSLFSGLKIESEDNGKYLEHMNKYPVFFITLKSLEFLNYEDFTAALNQRLAVEFEKFKYLLDSEHISEDQKARFKRIKSEQATRVDLISSLQFICHILFAHHKVKPILLIDEYDAPIHSAFQTGQYEECIQFMRALFSNALKDNDSLQKAALTGILRVAKESIFSDLNHIEILTVVSPNYANFFGLTEDELKKLIVEYHLEQDFTQVKYWYNGYQFGSHSSIYNPWSILSWLKNSEHEFKSYWLNTSSNELVRSLFFKHKETFQEDIFKILSGENITICLSEDLHFPSLQTNCSSEDYLTLLLHSGYLTVKNKEFKQSKFWYTLGIPNEEIKIIFSNMMELLVKQVAPNLNRNISQEIFSALEKNDTQLFEKYFSDVVQQVMSYHDFAKQPENAFHCFTAGFLSWLSHDYEVRSNRETGEGRADILLIPRNNVMPGYIIELKIYKPLKKVKIPPQAAITKNLNLALKQIEEKNYIAEFNARKIKKVTKIAMVFYGKKVWMKWT
ncbi:MAG: AAA family ATPase [Bdellovibrionota bacterium]